MRQGVNFHILFMLGLRFIKIKIHLLILEKIKTLSHTASLYTPWGIESERKAV